MVDSRPTIDNDVAWQVGCSSFRCWTNIVITQQKADNSTKMLSFEGNTEISSGCYELMVSVWTAKADFIVKMMICAYLFNFLVSRYLQIEILKGNI